MRRSDADQEALIDELTEKLANGELDLSRLDDLARIIEKKIQAGVRTIEWSERLDAVRRAQGELVKQIAALNKELAQARLNPPH